MTVYVDDMQLGADVPNAGRIVRGNWSHLFADTIAELEAFARMLGLRPEWQQNSSGFVHYDVVNSRRSQAIRLGARPVPYRDLPIYTKMIERRLPSK